VYPLNCEPHFQGDSPTGECFQLVEDFQDESATGFKGDTNFGFAFVSVSMQESGSLFYAYFQGIGVTAQALLSRVDARAALQPAPALNQTRTLLGPSAFDASALSLPTHNVAEDMQTAVLDGVYPESQFACRDGTLTWADRCTEACGFCEYGPATPFEWLLVGVPGIADLLNYYEDCAGGVRIACDGNTMTTYTYGNARCLGPAFEDVPSDGQLCYDAGKPAPGPSLFCREDAVARACGHAYYTAGCPGFGERFPTADEVGAECADAIVNGGVDSCVDMWYCPFFEYPGADQEFEGLSSVSLPAGTYHGLVTATAIESAPMRQDLRSMAESFQFKREVKWADGCPRSTFPCGLDTYEGVLPTTESAFDTFNMDFHSVCTPAIAGANPTGLCFHGFSVVQCEVSEGGCYQFAVLAQQTDGSYLYSNLYGQLPVFQGYLNLASPGLPVA
jgi:hypothetical protein